METSEHRILIVDDSDLDIMYVQKALKNEFSLHCVNSAEEALAVIDEVKPTVVLLDVKMQGMNGFELCKAIKENEDFEHCRILFISGLESIEEKLKGFECGACDFLSKPVDPQMLRKRIRVEIENYTLITQLANEKQDFFNVAMDAITSSGEVGVVLNFSRELFKIRTDEELGDLLLESLAEFGISVSFRLKGLKGDVIRSNGGPISELERKLLLNLDRAERIFEFGRQIVFNYDAVCILVRAEITDENARARYKDVIALMADNTVAFMQRLVRDQQMTAIGLDASVTVDRVQQKRQDHRRHMESLLLELITDLEQTYLSWDLSEEQETVLVDTVSNGLDNLNEHRNQGDAIELELDDILKRVSAL